jgi:membrane protein
VSERPAAGDHPSAAVKSPGEPADGAGAGEPETAKRPNIFIRAKDRGTGTLNAYRERWPWFDHLARAGGRYNETRGNYLAAAITYFSFLALFPLLLLALSIAGYVLAHNPEQQAALVKSIQDNVPGSVGKEFSSVVNTAVQRRGTIGIVSLLGVAYAGLGWIGNLRTALQVTWSCETSKENPIKAKLGDLLALIGLGLAIALSLGLTAGGTAAANALLKLLHLDGTTGMGTLVAVLGILLAVAADTLVFVWIFVRLPRRPIRYRPVLRGALFTAVGYEVLKIGATFYLARVGSNGLYGGFAGLVGLIIWLNLVSRFLLFGAAWTATAPGALRDDSTACDPAPEPQEPALTEPPLRPLSLPHHQPAPRGFRRLLTRARR